MRDPNRQNRVIELFRLMGYKVHENGHILHVSLETNSGKFFSYSLLKEDLDRREHIVEHVVSRINAGIVIDY